MKYYHGIPVNPGVAIGLASIVANNDFCIRPRPIESTQVSSELSRLDSAFVCAEDSLEEQRLRANEQLGEQYGQIFEAHLLILKDAKLRSTIESTIKSKFVCAEYAVDQEFRRYAKLLQSLKDERFADRANDIIDVRDGLLRHLVEVAQVEAITSDRPTVVAASVLNPSDAAKLEAETTLAIVTETGGLGSHTAIVAAALGVPTVLGLGPFISEIYKDDLVIVDGGAGLLIVNPDQETTERYQDKMEKLRAQHKLRESLSEKVVVKTTDSVEVEVKGNIEFPHEAKRCSENGAAGVGLYRTEFIYLASKTPPDEETHFQAYKSVLEAVGKEQSTTIRTFDLGADKTPSDSSYLSIVEPNPFMGLRSIRLSLQYSGMFRTQLRAILRASVYGKAKVMFPLVTTISEWRDAKAIFNDVRDDLADEGVPFDPDIPLGIMVETPATVVMLEQFAREVDFFSLGTNDLLQYTMAVDRSNEKVNSLYVQESPAVMRLIQHTVRVADHYGKPVSLCGQMASMPPLVPLLLGLGVRSLSVSSGMILQTKEIIEAFSMRDCQAIAQKALTLESAGDVRSFIRRRYRDVMGEDSIG